MSGHIELTVTDGIGHVVLARPEKHNAITRDMARELKRICLEIDDNDAIRVATITSAGERAFSASGGGATQLLPRLVGYGQAMRMLLTGDPVDADTALRIGLVEEVVEDAAVAARMTELAAKIAALSPVAVQATKAAVRAALSMPLEAGIRYESEIHVICMADKDRIEGIKAFQEKHEGKF